MDVAALGVAAAAAVICLAGAATCAEEAAPSPRVVLATAKQAHVKVRLIGAATDGAPWPAAGAPRDSASTEEAAAPWGTKPRAAAIARRVERVWIAASHRLGVDRGAPAPDAGAAPAAPRLVLDVYPDAEAKGLATGDVEPVTIAGGAGGEGGASGEGGEDEEGASAVAAGAHAATVVAADAPGVRGFPAGRAAAVCLARGLWGPAKVPAIREGLAIALGDEEAREDARFFASWIDEAGETTPLEDLLDAQRWLERSVLVQVPLAVVLVESILEESAGEAGESGRVDRLARAWRGDLDEPAMAALRQGVRARLAGLREDLAPERLARRRRRAASRERLDLRGFCLAHEGYAIRNGYLSAQAGRSMARVVSLGANAVSVTPFGFYGRLDEPRFGWLAHPDPRNAGGENDMAMRAVLARARRLGLATMIKPHLWGHAGWCGDIRMRTREDWDAWFETYGEFLVHYALLAEEEEADWLSIGCELRYATQGFPQRWAALAARARSLFAGGITYAANWSDEARTLGFADPLDAIGVDAYPPLSRDRDPTDAELEAGARAYLEGLDAMGRRLGKPVILTEIGYPAREACWRDPYRSERGAVRSPRAQARCLRALARAMEGMRAAREVPPGFFLWKWPTLERWEDTATDFWPAGAASEEAWQEVFATAGGMARSGEGREEKSLASRIEDAIGRGRAFVARHQREDGSFSGMHAGRYPTGVTALAMLAMLRSGSAPSEAPLSRALAWLCRRRLEKTYDAGMVLLALDAAGVTAGEIASPRDADPREVDPRVLATEALRVLVEGQQDSSGLWGYPGTAWDLSNTQLAILGLRAAQRMGWRIEPAVWSAAREGILDQQREDGAFSYRPRTPPSGSMTLAGIGSLCAIREVRGRGRDSAIEAAVERAAAWFAARFDPAWNAIGVDGQTSANRLYALWELERAGTLLHRERLGDHVWYPEGARVLVASQDKDGRWESVEGTCFALLFLSRATLTDGPRRSPRKPAASRGASGPGVTSVSPRPSTILPPDPDVPFLRDFLLLGPFPRSEEDPFATEVVPHEARLAGRVGHLDGSRRWRRQKARPDGVLDLAAAFGEGGDQVAFAYTEVAVDRPIEAVLHAGSDDGVLAWHDGEEVLRIHRHDALRRDAFTARLSLHPGRNRLLFGVENAGGAWALSARLSRPDGSPLPASRGAPRGKG